MSPAAATPEDSPPRFRWGAGSRLYLWLLPGVIACTLWPGGTALGLFALYNLAVALLWSWDGRRLSRCRVDAARELPPTLHYLAETRYRQILRNLSSRALRLWVEDELPPSFQRRERRHTVRVPASAQVQLAASFRPRERGRFQLREVALKLESRLGLAAITGHVPCPGEVRVIPLLERAGSALATRRREAGAISVRLARAARGDELDSLREYVPADPMRHVDWKATAKRNRPITRVYQPERSQAVWLVLDASRSMALPAADASFADRASQARFDVVLRAALRLADAALRGGDRVGALIYAAGRELRIAPARGRGQYLKLLQQLTTQQPQTSHLDVRGLVGELTRSASKRSLIVLFTDLENESEVASLIEHAPLLVRRHLVLCVSPTDPTVEKLVQMRPRKPEEVYLKAAAIGLLDERRHLALRLRRLGVQVLETNALSLEQKTLDRYFAAKASARL